MLLLLLLTQCECCELRWFRFAGLQFQLAIGSDAECDELFARMSLFVRNRTCHRFHLTDDHFQYLIFFYFI
jgi:hypothetical protein